MARPEQKVSDMTLAGGFKQPGYSAFTKGDMDAWSELMTNSPLDNELLQFEGLLPGVDLDLGSTKQYLKSLPETRIFCTSHSIKRPAKLRRIQL